MDMMLGMIVVATLKSILGQFKQATSGTKPQLKARIMTYLTEFIDNENFAGYDASVALIQPHLSTRRPTIFPTAALLHLHYTPPFSDVFLEEDLAALTESAQAVSSGLTP